MTNKRFWLRMLVMVLTFGMTVVGCDNGTTSGDHTHSYASNWSNNAAQHWHECSCGDKADVANHTFSGDTCTICGYNSTHTHSYASAWSNDATQHWHECSCGDKEDIAAHTGNPCTVCSYSSGGGSSVLDGTTWKALYGDNLTLTFTGSNYSLTGDITSSGTYSGPSGFYDVVTFNETSPGTATYTGEINDKDGNLHSKFGTATDKILKKEG